MQEQTLTKYDLKSSRFLQEHFRFLEIYHGLKFEKRVCLCPFHTETTPSFSQYLDSNGVVVRFNCFGCHINEDFFGVIMRLEKGLTFGTAISRFKNFVTANDKGGSNGKHVNESQSSSQWVW